MKTLKKVSFVASFLTITLLLNSFVVLARGKDEAPGLQNKESHGLSPNNNLLIEPKGNKVEVSNIDSKGQETRNNKTKQLDQLQVKTNDIELVSTDSGNTDDGNVTVKANNNAALIIKNKLAAQTHFPLMVNLDTNELIVNTPKGQKVVTVLPDAAVQNMLAANVLDELGGKGGLNWLANQATPSGTLSPTPASGSATPSEEPIPSSSTSSSIVQTENTSPVQLVLTNNGILAYQIDGYKKEKFLGIFNIKLHRTVFVSAESGGLLGMNESFFTHILDTLSL